MKIILLLILLFINNVYAAERPVWEDNCPEGLHDAVYKEIQWYWPDSTKATQEIYNYWAKRRDEFQEGLVECDFLLEEFRTACYENLRSKQAVANELYRTNIEHKKVSSQVWKETNKTNNWVMFNILPR